MDIVSGSSKADQKETTVSSSKTDMTPMIWVVFFGPFVAVLAAVVAWFALILLPVILTGVIIVGLVLSPPLVARALAQRHGDAFQRQVAEASRFLHASIEKMLEDATAMVCAGYNSQGAVVAILVRTARQSWLQSANAETFETALQRLETAWSKNPRARVASGPGVFQEQRRHIRWMRCEDCVFAGHCPVAACDSSTRSIRMAVESTTATGHYLG